MASPGSLERRIGIALLVGIAVAAFLVLTVYLWQTTEARRAAPSGADAPPAAVVTPARAVGTPSVPYRFDQPIARFELPADLVEISGLTVLDERTLGAVQDEEGTLFALDRETGEVTAVMPFGPPGDYEGVELVGDHLYVLRSDGVLFHVAGWGGGDMNSREIATGLARDCDAEGLGYDAARERLLIACKEATSEDAAGLRAVYAFDPRSEALDEAPAFVIDSDEVGGSRPLKPSAIAVHPVTGTVVVLSSAREVLVSLDASGAVADVWRWAEAGFEQPEGIAFWPNGDLVVSSEGNKRPAVLMMFAYEAAP